MAIKYLPLYYIGHLTECLIEREKKAVHWLARSGVDCNNPAASKLSMQAFDALLKEVFSQSGLHDLGLEFGKKLQIAHHGAFGLAILNALTLRDIVFFVQEYIHTRIPFIELSIIEEDDEVTILVHDQYWSGNSHRFIIEGMSMAMLNLFHAIKNRNNELSISRLFFDYPQPSYHQKYEIFKPAELAFEHAFSGISFAASLADNKLNGSDKLCFQQALALCEQEKLQADSTFTTAWQVRQIMLKNASRLLKLSEIANELAMSSRTLHRELQRENTSFKLIVDQVNAKKARQYLLANDLPVQTIAEKLGYSDTANFRRAFKRWYGCSPNDYKHASNSRMRAGHD